MLWRISYDPLCFQAMEAAINRSRLGAYLSQAHSFLSVQRRSPYVNKSKHPGEGVELLPGEGKYLFVYPFSKTRDWYRLSPHARQGLMDEHIAASAPFKGVRLNTSYSYGIDDQDFVVAFDSDYPQEFVDLVGRLRHTEASVYTQRDTPMFTCAKAPIDAILAQLASMLGLNRLPMHYHPLFRSKVFERVTDDAFFISIESWDPRFDAAATPKLLESLGARSVELLES